MKILKALVFFTDDNSGSLFTCDAIHREGKNWLIPKWLGTGDTPKAFPERFICIDNLRHQKIDNPNPHHFVLNEGIPKCVFDGVQPKDSDVTFLIVENPNIPTEPSIH